MGQRYDPLREDAVRAHLVERRLGTYRAKVGAMCVRTRVFATAMALLPVSALLPWRAVSAASCSFSVVKAAQPGSYSELHDVRALGASDAWAVGSYVLGSLEAPLIEHWDGATWAVVAAPTAGSDGAQLLAVAASSPRDVWAVGNYRRPKIRKGLVEHWDGTQWSIIETPRLHHPDEFVGVSANSSSDVWVVGTRYTSLGGRRAAADPLIEHWNGTAWRILSGVDTQPGYTYLVDVAARSRADVWVAGSLSGDGSSFIEHWNGSGWHIQLATRPGVEISSVSKLGWADAFESRPQGILTKHWNGTSWVSVLTPALDGFASPGRIRGSSPSDVWLVGEVNEHKIGATVPLIEHWNGTAWHIASLPVVPGHSPAAYLQGVTVNGPTMQVWAVGSYWNPKRNEALPLVYQRTC